VSVRSTQSTVFRDNLKEIPYLLYEVEQLEEGKKIVINKPGGKGNFGRLSRDDITVYPTGKGRWLSMDGILAQFGFSREDMETLLDENT